MSRRVAHQLSTVAAKRRSAVALLALGCLLAAQAPAAAHLQFLRGKLLELVQHSDLIIIGTADRVLPIGTRLVDTTTTVVQVLTGTTAEKRLTFRGPTRFAPGERYVFFLRRSGGGFTGAQDAGTVFPCMPADDAIYRSTVQELSRALRSDLATRTDAVRAALLPALTAPPAPLRYYAALDLCDLAHAGHPPTAAERSRIEQLVHDPSTDPAMQPLLTELVRLGATPAAHTPGTPSIPRSSGTPNPLQDAW